MKISHLHGIGLMALLGTTAFATVHCMAPPDLGDADKPDYGSDNLGGGSGSSTTSANEGELIGGTKMADTSGDDGDNDTMTKDAGGADDSGGHQLDAAQTDQGADNTQSSELDADNVGHERDGVVG